MRSGIGVAMVLLVAGLMLWAAGCEELLAPELGEEPAGTVGRRAQEEGAPESREGPAQAPAPAEPSPEEAPRREWRPPRFEERKDERLRMVREQITSRWAPGSPVVGDERVLGAMREVPRHLFVPPGQQHRAYWDQPLPIGYGQTISQPYIVGIMTEQLRVGPEDRVLEIGTGSGYQAAVLSELTPHVYTIEILEPLGAQARQRLEELGYDVVNVKIADGYYGWEEHAPFDGIIVTCMAGHVPPPLLKQLKEGGRMVIPVGEAPHGHLLVVTKTGEGQFHTRQLMPVGFVPMTGRAQKMP